MERLGHVLHHNLKERMHACSTLLTKGFTSHRVIYNGLARVTFHVYKHVQLSRPAQHLICVDVELTCLVNHVRGTGYSPDSGSDVQTQGLRLLKISTLVVVNVFLDTPEEGLRQGVL